MTHINPDDPKWTAYALGELDGAERAAVEAELASSEEARTLVEDLRFAAELTKSELQEGLQERLVVKPLTATQRETIHAAAGPVLRPRRWFITRPAVWVPSLAAACLALVALTLTRPQPQNLVLAPPLADRVEAVEKADDATPPLTTSKDTNKTAAEFGLRYKQPAGRTETAQPAPPVLGSQAKPALPTIALSERLTIVPAASTGTLTGSIKDAGGVPIPGVTITATNTQTGDVRNTATDEKGTYAVEGLATGNYKLTAALPGFQTETENGIQLAANTETVRDVTLQVGAVAQALEVTVVPTQTAQNLTDSLKTQRQGQVGGAGGSLGAQQGQQGQQGQQLGMAQAGRFLPSPATAAPSAGPGVPTDAFERRRPGSNVAESYDGVIDNPFLAVAQNPVSTFSIDVDTASYSNVLRFINQRQLPPRDAVRIEEMINYFNFDYPQPSGNNPVGATLEAASAPWNPQHRLVRVGIKARDLAPQQARKDLVEGTSGTLVTVAKDVNVQVEFNPAVVDAYRLIGYENRALRAGDFNDDKKDAGDMRAGRTVTVLYEVVPRGVPIHGPGISNETMNVKIRCKEPTASDSKLLVFPLVDREQAFSKATVDFRFATAVAEFGMILRDSPYKGTATINSVLSIAKDGIGSDKNGYRREFLQLVQRTRQIRSIR